MNIYNDSAGNGETFARIQVTGSSNPNNSNTVYCELITSTGSTETSGYLPIGNGDGWHTAKIKILPDRKVEFYLDGNLVYTSIGIITANYDGTMTFGGGIRKSYYDNFRVN